VSQPLSGERTAVHLLALPVPLAAGARQHLEELLREFTLIHASAADGTGPEVPRRLMAMVDALTSRFAGLNDDARERLDRAIDRGEAVLADHIVMLPPEAGPAAQALGDMLDSADEYCRQGRHLLTLATSDDVVAYRRWYLGEVTGQLRGAAATPWPQYRSRVAATA
jgi:hypothetical protein